MKRVVIVVILLFSVISFVKFASAATQFYFDDDFESYSLGYNTISPSWTPQYSSRVSIQKNNEGKYLQIDSFSPYGGDRDVHVAYNKIFYPAKKKKVSLAWDFTVVSCNETWKATEGVTPQGSSGYLYYNNPQDFISAELKIKANATSCGNGAAQVSVFKRVNSISTPLVPYTTYYFAMNKNYHVKMLLGSVNLTTFKISIYLDDVLVASSENVLFSDVKSGKFLLENGGTITNFDNVVIIEYK